jgi:hypothetical protein
MSDFKTVREQIKTAIEAAPALAGVPVFLERAGSDIEEDVEAALTSSGLAIIVMEADGGIVDQARSGNAVTITLTVPVAILNNVPQNIGGTGGANKPGETVLMDTIRAVIGREIGDGNATVTSDVFARVSEQAGVIEYYIGFAAPVCVRAS